MTEPATSPVRNSSWTAVRVLLTLTLTGSLISVVGLAFLSIGSTRPTTLGIRSGTLAVCPGSPNCVSSLAAGSPYVVSPIFFDDAPEVAMQNVLDIISRMDGVRIVANHDNYIHCEFSTRLFRFVDDLELLLDRDNAVIHFRSASRVGHYDFNANRERIDKIRHEFEVAAEKTTSTD
jgi:uncharacterized protein (DUF1499 family)